MQSDRDVIAQQMKEGAVDDVFLSLTPQVHVERHDSGSLRSRRR
jgi:hypothetical protein